MATITRPPGSSWRALVADSGQPRVLASYRTNLVTSLLGVWFTVGLFLDAWAHSNVPELESFFTPWHAVFYSGFTATAAWIGWLLWRNGQQGRSGLAAIPVGYGLAVLGLPVFAAAGVGDMLWHTFLGIEQDLTILFSPTHLVLITAMILILTSPLRSAWADRSAAPTLRQLLPAVLGLSFGASLVLLFVLHSNAMTWGSNAIVEAFSKPNGFGDGPSPNLLAASMTVTNVVLLAPLLLLARRIVVPAGTAIVLYAAVAGLSGAVAAFENISTIASVLIAGVAVDLLLYRLRPTAARRASYLGLAMLAPLITWTIYLGAASIAAGRLPAIPEYWTGGPLVATLQGLLLAVLFVPSLTQRNTDQQ